MQLIEARDLDLDTAIARYPDFPLLCRFGKPITLCQLMTHTAGFEDTVKDVTHGRCENRRTTRRERSLKSLGL
jgi:CubicO group peptidase (beta-lactamase class C family)